jgi:hypothetical protein
VVRMAASTSGVRVRWDQAESRRRQGNWRSTGHEGSSVPRFAVSRWDLQSIAGQSGLVGVRNGWARVCSRCRGLLLCDEMQDHDLIESPFS